MNAERSGGSLYTLLDERIGGDILLKLREISFVGER